VWPLRLVLPYVASQRPRWMISLGLFFYDHLAQRNVLPKSETIDLRRHPAGKPLKPEYIYAFAYSDCRGDDARLVIANLLGAQRHGARILPRHRFRNAQRVGECWRIELENLHSLSTFIVHARALVNAAGPWVLKVARTIAGTSTSKRLRMVRGSHIVVPRQWQGEQGYFLQTSDGRLMEAFPYESNFTSVGTTDEPWEDEPEKVQISESEITYMLNEVNGFLRRPITRDQIVWSYSGVRPLFEVGGNRDAGLSTLTRDYSFEVDHRPGSAPALTIFGGKLTTHRRLAEHAMQELSRIMPWPKEGMTRLEILPGGDFGPGGMVQYEASLRERFPWLPEPQISRYVRYYGTRTEEMLKGAGSIADLGKLFGSDFYEGEVTFLMETEWAETVDDLIWRRTKMGLRLSQAEKEGLNRFLATGRG
jgi:glycerol-3-phosphate dehydrogenase